MRTERWLTAGMVAGLIVSAKLSLLTTYAPIVIGAPPVRAPYLAAFLAGEVALPLVLGATLLADRFGRTPFPEAAMQVLGRVVGGIVAAGAAGLLVYLAATTTRALVTFVSATALRRTPLWAMAVLFLLPVTRAACAGLYGVGRLAKATAVATVAATLFLAVLLYHHMDARRLQPVLERGFAPLLHQALTPVGAFGEAAWIVLVVYPLVSSPGALRRAVWLGLTVNILVVALGSTMLVATFGPATLSRLMFPSYSAAEAVQQGAFLQRIEWTMVLAWIGTVYVKVTVLLYGASRFGAAAAGLRPGVGAVVATAAAVFAASLYVFHSALDVWMGYTAGRFLPPELVLEFGLPGLVLLAGAVRRRSAAR